MFLKNALQENDMPYLGRIRGDAYIDIVCIMA